MNGKLILFPVPIGADDISHSLPSWNIELLNSCKHFVVEEVRTARRFLKHAGYEHSIDDTTFYTLNEHTREDLGNALSSVLESYLSPIEAGLNVGLLSEAGLPCVADPGKLLTSVAQQKGIEIVPLVGPSSLMLALMASGFNGQNFAFVGYLPIDRGERAKSIAKLEQRVWKEHQTQIFIEAPYRNNQMLEALCETCHGETRICVACDLTLDSQLIVSHSVNEWKKLRKELNLHKRNTVFLLGE